MNYIKMVIWYEKGGDRILIDFNFEGKNVIVVSTVCHGFT